MTLWIAVVVAAAAAVLPGMWPLPNAMAIADAFLRRSWVLCLVLHLKRCLDKFSTARPQNAHSLRGEEEDEAAVSSYFSLMLTLYSVRGTVLADDMVDAVIGLAVMADGGVRSQQ